DALQVLFPEGSLASAEHLYQDAPSFRPYNLIVQEAVVALSATLVEGRTLRILEVGGGTGGLTAHLLPYLPADRTEYVFTDLSGHFVGKAEEKFRGYPFVRYQRLDIEQPPAEQGLAEHTFDLVLAFQVLHATADLRQTVGHLRQALAPGGSLIVLELMRPLRWPDFLFGLTEGWWRFRDIDLRPDSALLPFNRWEAVLKELRFTEILDLANRDPGGRFGVAALAARAPFPET